MQTWAKPTNEWKQIFSSSLPSQPTNNWTTQTVLNNFPLRNGFNQLLITYSYADGVKTTHLATIYWAPGVSESRSEICGSEKNGSTFNFQYVIKSDSTLSLITKNAGGGNTANFSWVAIWVRTLESDLDVL